MTGSNQVPLVLVGNKTDLHMQRSVSMKDGKDLADSWKAAFIESSAKQHETVKEIFKMVLLEIERQSGDVVDQKGTCTIS
jgi:Ras family protein